MKIPFSRKKADEPERRQEYIGQWPAMPLSSLAFGLGRSYQEADAVTGENSLQSIAFRAAVDLMASLVSELHFDVFSGEGIGRRKRTTPGNLEDPSGDGYGIQDWMYMGCQSWFLRGNIYGNILDQGPTGMLKQVDLFHPDRVNVHLEGSVPAWNVNGQEIPSGRMFHRRAYPVAGTLLGASPVAYHADSLGLTIAATRFGRAWFQDGGHPGGILSNSEADMSDDKVVRTAKDRFMAALFGTREPVVLGRGWKFDQIQIAPEESQFLETQQYSEAQAARIMGAGVAEVLGLASSSLTYANIVDRDIELLKYAADRWLKRMERILSAFLPRPQYVLFDRDSFLDTNVMQKWQVNKIKLDTGAYVIDEIRAKNNDGPVEWGKVPMALTLKPEPAADSATDPNTDPNADPSGDPPTGGAE